jgi:hypothetical protein
MPHSSKKKPVVHKIALTGGPGGGKTTAGDLLRREFKDQITLVPEAATLLFKGGFPRINNSEIVTNIQEAIFHVQIHIESTYSHMFPHHTLLCDRGTIDGAAYWPNGEKEFFKHFGTTMDKELKRYDAVIFFETAAAGGLSIDLGNPVRNEDQMKAIELDLKLQKLWQKHKNYIFIKNEASFVQKIMFGIDAMKKLL